MCSPARRTQQRWRRQPRPVGKTPQYSPGKPVSCRPSQSSFPSCNAATKTLGQGLTVLLTELACSTQSDCTGSLRTVRAISGFVSCTRHGVYTTGSATGPTLCGRPMPTCQGWCPKAAQCRLWVTPGEADVATCVRSAGAVPLQERAMRPTTVGFAHLYHSCWCRATIRGAGVSADGAGYLTAAQIGSAEIHTRLYRPHLHSLMDQMIQRWDFCNRSGRSHDVAPLHRLWHGSR